MNALLTMPHLTRPTLLQHPLTAGLPPADLAWLASEVETLRLPPGATLIAEGEPEDGLYLVQEGRLQVTRQHEGAPEPVAVVEAGEVIGELALLSDAPRSASVHVAEAAVVLRLNSDTLAALKRRSPATALALIERVSAGIAERLRRQSVATLESRAAEARQRRLKGVAEGFVLATAVAFSVYNLALEGAQGLIADAKHSAPLSAGILLLLSLALLVPAWRSGVPARAWGLRWGQPRRDLAEAAALTAAMAASALGLKLALIQPGAPLEGAPLFRLPGLLASPGGALRPLAFAALYGALVPLQELIARGVLQTALSAWFTGPRRVALAVVLSNLLFAAMHVHLGSALALIVVAPGLAWGWLYQRQRSLLGVTVSHLLVGWWALFILGFKP